MSKIKPSSLQCFIIYDGLKQKKCIGAISRYLHWQFGIPFINEHAYFVQVDYEKICIQVMAETDL